MDGSSFDTTLGVYTGTTVGSLTSIAQDDEGGVGSSSRVVFTATAGVTYQIAVDGYFGASGNITDQLAINVAYTWLEAQNLTAGSSITNLAPRG